MMTLMTPLGCIRARNTAGGRSAVRASVLASSLNDKIRDGGSIIPEQVEEVPAECGLYMVSRWMVGCIRRGAFSITSTVTVTGCCVYIAVTIKLQVEMGIN